MCKRTPRGFCAPGLAKDQNPKPDVTVGSHVSYTFSEQINGHCVLGQRGPLQINGNSCHSIRP